MNTKLSSSIRRRRSSVIEDEAALSAESQGLSKQQQVARQHHYSAVFVHTLGLKEMPHIKSTYLSNFKEIHLSIGIGRTLYGQAEIWKKSPLGRVE